MGEASRRKRERRGMANNGLAAPVELIAVAQRQARRDAALIGQLYRDRQQAYERTAAVLARPASLFMGFRDSRGVVSISSRPQDPHQLVDRFTLACLTLDVLAVDQVVLLSGDEIGAALLAPADLTPDLDCFMLVCAARRDLGQPTVLLTGYQLDRSARTIRWGQPLGLLASETQGLWAEHLAPLCFARTAPSGPGALDEYLAGNRQLGNDVLILDTSATT